MPELNQQAQERLLRTPRIATLLVLTFFRQPFPPSMRDGSEPVQFPESGHRHTRARIDKAR